MGKSVDADVISPLVGEMGGSPEGGVKSHKQHLSR